jgi:hypothetical protein
MATEDMLKEFNGHVEEYALHRTYIERAKTQAHKFSPQVVEKVILDHEVLSAEIADKILPLVPSLDLAIAELNDQHKAVQDSKTLLDARIEELTLRQIIGELSDEAFAEASSAFKREQEESGKKIEALVEESTTIETAIKRWIELAEKAEQATGRASSAAEKTEEQPSPFVPEEPERAPHDALDQEPEGPHASHDHVVEDVSSIFDGSEPVSVESGSIVAIETDEGSGAPGSSEIDFGYAGEAGEVELELAPAQAPSEGEVIDLSVGAAGGEVAGAPAAVGSADQRRALLLYQEGTPEEQIYPFTGDVLTIGRGRDNDIQIKNDSKVSRYHCRVFRRGLNFYIEDNKSSNGTLVNGELITERRLFGGEEVIIGETFFRFRIMD